ncbi:MAG TPA: hypothetical protein PL055_04325 [Methanobacterium sp.]|jgi:hypothetical protein|nr:MAG: hypothetical protein FGO69_04765 [Methanobacterium sp.]HOI39838.1 hypothetical protein [Methanobacterium sp.]HOI70980.1 hypothetical protein [Methanobacterium sp.]HPX77971.1 hypothetical protein [Methanobacterium sp.]
MINEQEFDSAVDFDDEWFEDQSLVEETHKELEQARGEVVLDAKKKRLKTSKVQGIALTFEDTESLDDNQTYTINLSAESIKIGISEDEDGNFKKVGIAQLKGNKLLEYITYLDDEFNPQLTMAFENGYSIEISGRVTIEEVSNKPNKKKKQRKKK